MIRASLGAVGVALVLAAGVGCRGGSESAVSKPSTPAVDPRPPCTALVLTAAESAESWVGVDLCAYPLRIGPMVAPRLVHRVDPAQVGCVGTVVVEFVVERDGLVSRPVVVRGLGAICDMAALDAVSKWRFLPALWRGPDVDAPGCEIDTCEPVPAMLTWAVVLGAPESGQEATPLGRVPAGPG